MTNTPDNTPVDNQLPPINAVFEEWVVTQDAYIAIANVHKEPLQRNAQGVYLHHGIRLAFQAFAISHGFKQLGQAAAKTAETLKAMVDSLNGLKDIDVKELGNIIKDATRQRLERKTAPDRTPPEYVQRPELEERTHG